MKKIASLLIYTCFLNFVFAQNEVLNDTIINDTITKKVKTGLFVRAGINLVDSTGELGPFNTITSPEEMAFQDPFEAGLEYRFSDLLAVGLDGSINSWRGGKGVIDSRVLPNQTDYWAVDAKVKLFIDEAFNIFEDWQWLDLYLDGGVGFFEIKDKVTDRLWNNPTGNFGIGGNAWLNDYTAIYLEGTAKWVLDDNTFPNSNHFQFSAGVMLRISELDSDKDGLKDSKDLCPKVFGPIENMGCPEVKPETIIVDNTVEPDTIDSDGDGVVNKFDRCPDTPGLIQNFGCPDVDTDGDGVSDSIDRCPDLPGNNADGCPENDTDGDGVINSLDKCPDVFGSADNQGCPKKDLYEGEDINRLLSNVYFDFDKYNIKPQYIRILENNIRVMKDNPNRQYTIVGHTDDMGSDLFNQSLSKARAKTVFDYLKSKGIPASSIKMLWEGEKNPISTNDTQQGRALNRRVEFKASN